MPRVRTGPRALPDRRACHRRGWNPGVPPGAGRAARGAGHRRRGARRGDDPPPPRTARAARRSRRGSAPSPRAGRRGTWRSTIASSRSRFTRKFERRLATTWNVSGTRPRKRDDSSSASPKNSRSGWRSWIRSTSRVPASLPSKGRERPAESARARSISALPRPASRARSAQSPGRRRNQAWPGRSPRRRSFRSTWTSPRSEGSSAR
jgi:hypothetical protein